MKDTILNTDVKSLFPEDEEEDVDDTSWQVSYLDIITIVLGFLIILLSISQIVPEVTSLSTLYGKTSDRTRFITTPIEEIIEELKVLLEPQIEDGSLMIYKDLNDIRIRLKGDDFYSSGSATLQGSGMDLLNYVIRAFQQISYNDFNIDVEGHTDNLPISNERYASNWELSTARASNVVRYFTIMGLETNRLQASGYADSKPLINFDSDGNPYAASREENRRVVLRLFYTAEGLRQKAIEDSLAAMQLAEAPENETEPESTISGLEQEIQRVNAENLLDNTTDDTANEPIGVETLLNTTPVEVPTPVAETPSEPITPSEPAALPSFLNPSSMCGYSVEIGNYRTLVAGFQGALDAEIRTGIEFELAANNNVYSARTKPMSSYTYALDVHKQITSEFNDPSIGLVHQCYNTTSNIPEPLQYQIQFGVFSNETNAINFSNQISQQYQIQTNVTNRGSSYFVFSGPYNTRENVLNNIQAFRNRGLQDNIFIKPFNNTGQQITFDYQIQMDVFTSEAEAQFLSGRLSSALGIPSSVSRTLDGNYVILTERTSSLNQAMTQFQRFKSRVPSSNPVLFYLETL